MAKTLVTPTKKLLHKGDRVTRKDTDEQGTVVEADGNIKVKWDAGRTSYFKRGTPANMRTIDSDDV